MHRIASNILHYWGLFVLGRIICRYSGRNASGEQSGRANHGRVARVSPHGEQQIFPLQAVFGFLIPTATSRPCDSPGLGLLLLAASCLHQMGLRFSGRQLHRWLCVLPVGRLIFGFDIAAD